MKFLADGMLGKLSRWLRMLGCDVEYYNNLDDEELIQTAAREGRILITRDAELHRRASILGLQSYLLKGQNEVERLAEVARRFGIKLEIDVDRSRCPKCNILLRSVKKEEIIDRIPDSTSRFYNNFWICPNCGQIYWQGSHWSKIKNTLLKARQLSNHH
ncbi:MAG: Mut7-C RNAse domain-containing protein [Nitrososphaerota archaeon]|nr:Mut7-C RNAse domain-containing protein [Candidatus Bathyarchaeota archaeon]MDW8048926.1 Mut7-C RNAse domain-containing protein [Nitrososphaerota archaeon]